MEALLTAMPWLVLLAVFVGEKIQQVIMVRAEKSAQATIIEALRDALTRAQGATVPSAAPAIAPAARPPVVLPLPPRPPQLAPAPIPRPPAVVPSGPFGDYPKWFQAAVREIGFHETGNNLGIEKYIALAHTGALGEPWCAIFANAMLETSGVPGTRSPSSQSFRSDPNFVSLPAPAKGCIVVYWRISKASGQGHVGFYAYEDSSRIWTLGGNENDMVQIEALPKDSASFGLVGYFWPKSIAMPQTGAVPVPSGTPASIQSAPAGSAAPAAAAPGGAATAKQTNITATVFGGQQSAYGPPIDDASPGVALPCRFEGPRPRVRLVNVSTGASVICDIVDVGPWNTRDDYWNYGRRPQAESGFDLSGRKTNGAGIDLTRAAAAAIAIDGKGRVDWDFLPTSPPNVT